MLKMRKDQLQTMAQARPNSLLIAPCRADASWIEVVLVNQDGSPVANEKYRITLPDGSIQEGTLDENGSVRFDSIVPGDAEISFPEITAKEWNRA